MRYHLAFVVVSSFTGLAGCAHAIGRPAAKTPEALYAVGIEDMEGGLFPEALKDFGEVKAKFPYSRYAALAELRTADTHFRRGKYLEAVDAYRTFLKFHPNHDQAAYAMYRVGESYFEQIPTDWWFMPPGAEKDQGSTRMAISAFQDMLARFNGGPMADLAREHLDACRRKLADHEMYVARFYFDREHYDASERRAEAILHDYAGLGLDEEALWIAGKSAFTRGDRDAAGSALQRLMQQFPEGSRATEARGLLNRLGASTKAAPGAETYPATGPKT